jgi:hypothetical protein
MLGSDFPANATGDGRGEDETFGLKPDRLAVTPRMGGNYAVLGLDYMDPKVRELIVISLFAAVCTGIAVVQGQGFLAAVLAAECTFGRSRQSDARGSSSRIELWPERSRASQSRRDPKRVCGYFGCLDQ